MDFDKEDKFKNLVLVVRALITSSKGPVTLGSIMRDYSKEEGRPMPFRDLGYRDAQELLQATQAFCFHRIDNEICVTAKHNPKTEHIASMVRAQKRSKDKRVFARLPAPRFGGGGYSSNYSHSNSYQGRSFVQQPQYVQQQLIHRQQQISAAQQQVRQAHNIVNTHQQQQHPQRQQQQQQPQPTFSQDFQRLSAQLKELQQQQELQKKQQLQQQQELKRTFEEERQRQEKELLRCESELQKQKSKIDQLRKVLKEQQERGHKEQLCDLFELKTEREELQRQKATLDLLQQEMKEHRGKEQEKRQKQLEQLRQAKAEAEKRSKTSTIPEPEPIRNSSDKQKQTQLEICFKNLSFQEREEDLSTPPNMNGKSMQRQPLIDKPPLRPILGNSSQRRAIIGDQFETPPLTPSPSSFQRHPHLSSSPALQSQQPPHYTRSQPASSRPASSVNDRLKLRLAVDNGPTVTPPLTPETPPLKQGAAKSAERVNEMLAPSPELKMSSPGCQFDPAYDAVSSLVKYCVSAHLPPPAYSFYNTGTRIHCTVRIDSSIYSSYPMEYLNKATAKQKTAELAFERLRLLESRKHLPVCAISDEEFLDTLYQELLNYPHGIVSRKLPEWYEQTFNHQVPSHWWSLVNASPRIRLENGLNMIIVYAGIASATGNSNSSQGAGMPELQLPWSEGQHGWSMIITYSNSTAEVWGRLIGGAYSSGYDKMARDLDAHMSQPQFCRPAQNISEQQIYVVEVCDGWNRARVLSVDTERQSCSCFLIDFGDVVAFDLDELFECQPAFMTLPPQAICLSMYALENYDGHPHAQAVLKKELNQHTVVARIISTEEQFNEAGGRPEGVSDAKSKRRACIVAVFYDTSTADDIDMNELVSHRINKGTPAPQLKLEEKSNPVLVSHINDEGDLFVLLPNEDLKFVQRTIVKLVAASPEQQRVAFADLQRDNLFFVCDESGGAKQWHRGKLTSKPQSPEEETFDVYYVDDGRLRKTHISNLYRLAAINMALASFPPQALRVRLHNVPPIDNQMVGRLRGLMSPQSEVLLKVMEGGGDKLPMVTIHARGQGGLYLCVNSAIRMEYEVQSTAQLEPFEDGQAGQLQRHSSFSSTVSSNSNSTNSSEPLGQSATTPPPASQTKTVAASVAAGLKDYEAIPAVGAFFEVRVALSVNPGDLAVQPYKWYNQLQRMMKVLQTHCLSEDAKGVKDAQLSTGQSYAAPDSQGVYHRVNIHKIYDEMIHVRFVDFGDDGIVRSDQLLQLPSKLRELPKMALPAQLFGIKLEGVLWTQENCVRFRQLTLGQKFIGIVRKVEQTKDEARLLTLELIDTSTPEDIRLHEILILEKHAQRLV